MRRSAASRNGSGGSSAPSGAQVPIPRFLQRGQGTQNRRANPGVMPSLMTNGVPATTILLCNVNRRLTQEDVLRILPRDVYKYDLLYLLFDTTNKRGSGRVFINFETQWHALAFRNAVHGVQSTELSAIDHNGIRKPLFIEPARRQGFFQNVGNWQRTLQGRNMPAAMFPAVFIYGYRVNVFGLRTPMAGTSSSSSSSSRP